MVKKSILFIFCCLIFKDSISADNAFQKYFKEPFILPAGYVHKMTPENVGDYYKMLQVVDKVFTEHGVTYWIDGGTLLGAVRHGGMIPWDDDADIEVFKSDAEKIWSLNSVFNKLGYKVSDWSWGDGLRIYPIDKKQPKLDIFLVKEVAGKVVIANGNFPKNYWYLSELTHFVRMQFGPIQLNAPYEVMRYLYTFYGKDVLTHAHVRPSATHFTIIDFSPAEYVL